MTFYTIEEVAKMTNKSQKTIRRQIAAKLLVANRIQNKYRIFESDYKNWCDNETIQEQHCPENEFKKNNAYHDIVNWVNIKNRFKINGWKNINTRNGYNFIDLFSGAGGLSCGLTMAGFTPLASVEIMPQAIETYEYNFILKKGFKEKIEARDIRSTNVKKDLYDSVAGNTVDLIVGGFPCQGFSLSGNRVVTDERNSLYLEMLKIVKHLQPEYIVMENVEGLRSMLDGKIEAKIIADYAEIGYKINVTVLNSADYGVAQIRKRVIFIGNRVNGTNYHPKPFIKKEKYKKK